MEQFIVVVVEDEEFVRLIAVEALSEAGFHVFEAEHAEAALAILSTRASDVHALFTDVNMPGTMDGVALAHHSQRNWPWIALLIASGRPLPQPHHLPTGSRFLPKPYHPYHVVSHLHDMLASR